MPEYKYLDKTGLTTFKSKIDVTYAKKNNVYTKSEVDAAIADASIPTVVVTTSQVISQSPLRVQLTDEQYAAMNGQSVIFDGTAVGMTTVVADFIGSYTDDNDITHLKFTFVYSEDTDYLYFHTVIVNTSTKVAELRFDNIYPHQSEFASRASSAEETDSINYSTTAPTSAYQLGSLQIVVLSSEPATRYDGYLYIITGSN